MDPAPATNSKHLSEIHYNLPSLGVYCDHMLSYAYTAKALA